MQEEFNSLKLKPKTSPVLGFPNFEILVIVETDATSIAVGAVLPQKQEDGTAHTIQ